jgi:PAS domain S-box-containing protein
VRLENQHDEMESQLKQSEELHRFIVNSSPDLVYMLDRNGCFTFINDRIESMLGIDRKALVGRHYSDLVDEDDIEKANNLFNERRTGARAGKNVEIRLKSERSDHRYGQK